MRASSRDMSKEVRAVLRTKQNYTHLTSMTQQLQHLKGTQNLVLDSLMDPFPSHSDATCFISRQHGINKLL